MSEKKPLWETVKFILRMALLIFGPQLLAWAVANPGMWWANILSAALPIIDKYIHESPDIKLNGLTKF